MAREVSFKEDVWKSLKKGIDTVGDAVSSTMGPKGRNVVINNFGKPMITNDGVTVARGINLKDPKEDAGAKLLIEVSSKSNDAAGDGTSASALLGQSIFNQGLKYLLSGADPIAMKKGIELATESVVDYLKTQTKPVETKDDIFKVATISANNDEELGMLISDAIARVGKDGVITVEESKNRDTYIDVVEGLQFNKGFVSPYFVTNGDKMTAEMKDPYILFTDKKLTATQEIIPLLEQILASKRPLVIIADEISNSVVSDLLVNKLKGVLQVVAVQAPLFGDKRKEMLQDMAILCGGTYITADLDMKLEEVKLEDLGQASSVTVKRDETIIVDGRGAPEVIEEHLTKLKASEEGFDTEFEKEKVRERVARLSGGVAVIFAGASTETELKEKKMRIEDALCATKASYEEGIVVGGGLALLNASRNAEVFNKTSTQVFGSDVELGIKIIQQAIKEPFNKILSNAGYNPETVADKIFSYENMPQTADGVKVPNGMNVATGVFVDMFDEGIVDPVKVTRSALQNSSSIMGLLLTTGAMITDIPEENNNSQQQMQMPMM